MVSISATSHSPHRRLRKRTAEEDRSSGDDDLSSLGSKAAEEQAESFPPGEEEDVGDDPAFALDEADEEEDCRKPAAHCAVDDVPLHNPRTALREISVEVAFDETWDLEQDEFPPGQEEEHDVDDDYDDDEDPFLPDPNDDSQTENAVILPPVPSNNPRDPVAGIVPPLVRREANDGTPGQPDGNTNTAATQQQEPATTLAPTPNAPDIDKLGSIVYYPVDHPSYTEQAFLPMDKSMMRLYDYCEFTNCPRYFLDGILEIIGEEIRYNGFQPHLAPKRKTFVDKMMKRFNAAASAPVCVDVPLVNSEHDPYKVAIPQQVRRGRRDVVQTVKFNVVRQILDLLDDRDGFGNLHNLVVNPGDPFSPYQNNSGKLDEVLDGSWYQDTIGRLQINIRTEFVFPLVLYMDKTGADVYQRYGMEPIVFSSPILRRALRMLPRFWRCAGFIPDLELKSSATKQVLRNKKSGKGSSMINYHRCLSIIIEAINEADREGIYTWLRLGDQVKYVRLRIPIAFVIGDGKSGDQICQRFAGYTGIARLSRPCTVSFKNADSPTEVCELITAKKIDSLVQTATSEPKDLLPPEEWDDDKKVKAAKEEINSAQSDLVALSAHQVLNAFRESNFGGDERGIYGATPTDLMHAFQSGWLRYLVKLALDKLTPTNKKRLDDLVDELLGGLRSSEKENYPRCNFSHGFTNLTMITSDEWAGMMFTLLIVMRTPDGEEIMGTVFSAEEDIDLGGEDLFGDGSDDLIANLEAMADQLDEENCTVNESLGDGDDAVSTGSDLESEEEASVPCSLGDFLHLCEALLSFHAWYKYGAPYEWSVVGGDNITEKTVLLGIRKMLALVRLYVPRKKGNGWKLQKFHDLLHLARDMARFGSPQNFDAGPGESSLRFWAKKPSLTAQKRGYTVFLRQVAARLYELQVMAAARRAMGITGLLDGQVPDLPSPGRGVSGEDSNGTGGSVVVGNNETATTGSPPPVFCGSSFCIDRRESGVIRARWSGSAKKRRGHLDVHPLVLRYFSEGPEDMEDEEAGPLDKLLGYTELLIHSWPESPLRIRAHPNYHNEGPWFDWVIIRYDPSLNRDFQPCSMPGSADDDLYGPSYKPYEVPAKVLCFLAHKDTGEMQALVHACDFRRDNAQDSILTEVWELEYKRTKDQWKMDGRPTPTPSRYHKAVVRCVDIASIIDRVFVVEHTPGLHEGYWSLITTISKKVLLIRKRQQWAKYFV